MTDAAERELFIRALSDKYRRCEGRNILTSTKFLTPAEQQTALEAAAREGWENMVLSGGPDFAERKIALFLPSYMEEEEGKEQCLTLIRCLKSKRDKLTHRDYLGSLMGLGIERETVGDIFVHPMGADIIVLSEMADFLLLNFEKAGRKALECRQMPLSALIYEEKEAESLSFTVTSPRLDAVAARIWNLSRTDVKEYIEKGLVFVGGEVCKKPDRELFEGDSLSIRGFGKAEILKDNGYSKKGKIRLEVGLYR